MQKLNAHRGAPMLPYGIPSVKCKTYCPGVKYEWWIYIVVPKADVEYFVTVSFAHSVSLLVSFVY